AAWHHDRRPELTWVDATVYEKQPARVKDLLNYDGVLVPGGFGGRGIDGIIRAIRFVREHNIPYLGLCYGMQLACVELARNVAKLRGAHTVEIEPKTPHPIIIVNPYQQENIAHHRYGGTMRLGAYPCRLTPGTRAHAAYGVDVISERHRHRYEFNNEYRAALEKAGLVFSGEYTKKPLVEIVELRNHPWFVGVQFHPEFKSRPLRPHPLFREFIRAAVKRA
ncbi:MAG: CTP synthase, partial [Patescibacteria group bacterium]